jgi:hypothetical protein
MVKNNTLIVLLCAVILAGAVYYFDFRHPKDDSPIKDTTKPAFSFQASDVTGLTLSHPARAGEPAIEFEKRGGKWQITKPVETAADQSTVEGLVDEVAGARFDQSEPGTPDRLKVYGLDPPRTSLEVRMQNGSKHTVLLGEKDFTGGSVYTIVDGGKTVSLLPAVLFDDVAKPLDNLRDSGALHIDSAAVASFDLKNSSGELSASKEKDLWRFSKPNDLSADSETIQTLLGSVGAAKFTGVVAETPENLAKYGLAAPAVTFTTTDDKGAKATLLVGKKDGDDYFARDTSRPTIFRISGDLYKKLAEGYADLRDKVVVHVDTSDIQSIELRNDNGSVVESRKKDSPDEWDIDSPADQKGKTAASYKIFDPLTMLRAEEVIDHPTAALLAQLAKPAITVILTDKAGKLLTVRVSKPVGDFAYAQSSNSAALYKVKKQVVNDLSLKPADAAL